MRILVCSDSHGRVQPMLDAAELYRPQAIFHLGDVIEDAEKLHQACPELPLYQVWGNCDDGIRRLRPPGETEKVVSLAGKTIFYLHGDTRYVRGGPGKALEAAKAKGADILLYGHTHAPLHTQLDGVLVVNPGAIQDGRCAFLSWENGGEVTYFPVSL